ncbi:MAG TPA: response regulator [Planctomycetota bacterium]|jgi:DNA-binding response OmpR family regulator|nr:response regulator [Planctomycetota bacterium]HZJ70866.1 response regulator [Planctomycetota bacterium]
MKRILVVEDEEEVAGLLKARLESNGYEVRLADRGRDALEAARADRPDLVVLDLMLPDMDGYAVSEQLRERYSSRALPILMLTARYQPRDKLLGFGMGADAFMTKPFNPRELLSTIAELLAHAEGG